MANKPGPKIEFLFWEDCPSHPKALELLQEVMAEVGVDSPIEKVEVVTDEDAARLLADSAGFRCVSSCRTPDNTDTRPSPRR